MQAVEEGDLSLENVEKIATQLDVSEDDVVQMNRRLAAPDNSLNAPLRVDGDGEWQDWLVDQGESQEAVLAEQDELTKRRKLLNKAMDGLNDRERRIIVERRLSDYAYDARGIEPALQHQPRARASDRGPRLREAAKVDPQPGDPGTAGVSRQPRLALGPHPAGQAHHVFPQNLLHRGLRIAAAGETGGNFRYLFRRRDLDARALAVAGPPIGTVQAGWVVVVEPQIVAVVQAQPDVVGADALDQGVDGIEDRWRAGVRITENSPDAVDADDAAAGDTGLDLFAADVAPVVGDGKADWNG